MLVRGEKKSTTKRRPGGLKHDPACPHCNGTGHAWVDAESVGYKRLDDGSFAAPGGGIVRFHHLNERTLMRLCACVKARA